MRLSSVSLVLAALVWCGPTVSQASQITIDPTSDGSLYTCAGCSVVSDGDYVVASGYIQGAVKFSTTPITDAVTHVFLTLNPYGLPLSGTVDVYGYGTAIGMLDEADANAGTFLGTLVLPDSLGLGEDVFFDVTAFVASTHAPFIAFNLRSAGTDVFSSLEFNYGHASQLLVTTEAPEPATVALLLAGLLVSVNGIERRRLAAPLRRALAQVIAGGGRAGAAL